MSDMENTEGTEDTKVAELVRGAGKRTPLPDDVRDRMEATFRSELAKSQQRHRFTQVTAISGLAASVIVSVVLVFQYFSTEQRHDVATVLRDRGEVTWQHLDESGPLRRGNRIQAGDVLRTGNGVASITPIGTELDVRLASMSEVMFVDATTLRLNHGSIYVDSDPTLPHFPLKVLINGFSVEHLGTQYLVSQVSDGFEIAVREGEVVVEGGPATVHSGKVENQSGKLITIAADHSMEVGPAPVHDQRWHWVSELAPAIETHGLPITDFLEWFSRETGYQVSYASTEAADEVTETIRGPIDTENAFQALHEAMRLSQLKAVVNEDQGTVLIQIDRG